MRDIEISAGATMLFSLSSTSPRYCSTDNLIKPTKDWSEYLTELPTIDDNNKTITLKFKKEYATTKPNVAGTIGLYVDVYFFPFGAKVEKITCEIIDDGDCYDSCEADYYYGDSETRTPIPRIDLNAVQVEVNKPLIYSNNFDNITKIERLYVFCMVQYSNKKFAFYVDLPQP